MNKIKSLFLRHKYPTVKCIVTPVERQLCKVLQASKQVSHLLVKFDIDHFAALSSRYDAARGEQLLSELTEAMHQKCASYLFFARMEQGKFLLLTIGGTSVLTQLQVDLAEAVQTLGLEQYIGVIRFSFGAYQIADKNEAVADILQKVHAAHKSAARHPYKNLVWYDESLVQAIAQENYYNEHLQEAMQKKELRVYLQYQAILADAHTLRAEALVRWALPNGRLIYPDSFLPQFEKNGEIVALDFYVLEEVCAYVAQFIQETGRDIAVSVNISHVTLFQPDFVARFTRTVQSHGIAPQNIMIEMQEVQLLGEEESIVSHLSQLRALGFYVAIEAFASARSNIGLLASLPVQILKLDRKLLRASENYPQSKVILAGIIDLAHRLGLQMVCEGVEHAQDVTLLKEVGCDILQGYYIAKPIPKEEFVAWLGDFGEEIAKKLV